MSRFSRWVMVKRVKQGLMAIALTGMGLFASLPPTNAETATCTQPLTDLVPKLLIDLPSYANRVGQRSRTADIDIPLDTYILIAGNPDYAPLPLPQQQWQPTVKDTTQQVFFTTLERQYTTSQALERQNFYWAFFVDTQQGWQLALLYQQLGGATPNAPTSPRRDASTGNIAQGIRLWLRDCQANAINHVP